MFFHRPSSMLPLKSPKRVAPRKTSPGGERLTPVRRILGTLSIGLGDKRE